MEKGNYFILIPAYKPTGDLAVYSRKLTEDGYNVVVVNDGSGSEYDAVFASLPDKAVLVSHDINKGKGAALKTGINYIKENYPAAYGIVTADADGQHRPEDIARVAETLDQNPNALILGSRKFEGNVPAKSRFGNTVTRWIFSAVSGVKVRDTQTGLRAFSVKLTDFMLSLEGDKYEYEMNMLMYAAKEKIPIIEVDIETVYLNDNASSHFDPLKDSIRIYARIFKFAASSLASFAIDFVLLFVFKALTKAMPQAVSLLVSVIAARCVSSLFNFFVNRKLVFKDKNGALRSALKYYLLAACILGLNYALMWLLNIKLGIALAAAKLVTELLLFILSYNMQKKYVFKNSDNTDRRTEL